MKLVGGTVVGLDPVCVEKRDVGSGDALDCSGCLILPGFVLGHTHLYSGLAAGMPGPDQAPTTFREILERVWWRLDRALDEESLELSAKVAAIAAVRAGVSCIVDHHESPSFIDGSLDVIERAVRSIGVRAILTYGATDRHGGEGARRGLAESERFAKAHAHDPFVRGMIGLHAPFTASDDTIANAVELTKTTRAGLHLHAAEGPDDQRAAHERWKQPLFMHLDSIGALTEKTLVAHAVDLSPKESRALSRSFVAHQARSNMNNAVGFANEATMSDRLVLGTDGIDGDLLAELKTAFFRRREALGPSAWPDAPRMLAGGHRLQSTIFERNLEDFTVLDYDPPTPLDVHSLGAHLVFGMSSTHVRDVFVEGKAILRDRKIVGVDEAAIHARAREVSRSLFQRMEAL